jgi:hypothetical protein
VKARHAVVMRFLSAGSWGIPHYKPLKGKALKGLGEIIVGAGVEWRLIGHRDQSLDSFTVLIICNHKSQIYKPADAFETAAARWKEMRNGLQGVRLDAHPG